VKNSESVQSKIDHLNKYIGYLRIMQKNTFEDFFSNMMIHGSVERYLHLCIEITIDLGNHIIAKNNLGSVEWNRDVADIFFEKGYINSESKGKWIQMIKFRNLLVHEYAIIDKKEVYNILQNHLNDIIEIERMFADKFLVDTSD